MNAEILAAAMDKYFGATAEFRRAMSDDSDEGADLRCSSIEASTTALMELNRALEQSPQYLVRRALLLWAGRIERDMFHMVNMREPNEQIRAVAAARGMRLVLDMMETVL